MSNGFDEVSGSISGALVVKPQVVDPLYHELVLNS